MTACLHRRVPHLLASVSVIAIVVAALPAARAADGEAGGQPAAPLTQGAAIVRLPILSVEGDHETARGPVDGYVARRSATGTKTDTPLLETPQAISVVTREQIENQAIGTINEALRYSPGAYGTTTDFRGEYFNIRGFTADVYLDGLRVPVPTTSVSYRIEPWGMERIEILRGASSSLYGQANLGGIVNAVSKVPRPDQVNQVALQGGSFNRIQGMVDVGGRLDRDGTLLWRFNGLVRDADTFVDSTTDNRIYLAPSLSWRPTADTTLTVLASYLRDDLGVTGQWLPPRGTLFPNPNGQIPRGRITGEPGWDRYRKTQYGLGTILEHRVNEAWTLRQNLRWTYQDIEYASIYGANYSPATQQRLVGRVASYQQPTYYSVGIDNQAEVRFRTGPLDHTMLFGLDYRVLNAHTRTWTAAATPLDIYAPVFGVNLPALPRGATGITHTNQTQQQFGLYAQDQVRLENWILTLTGRQDWSDIGTHNNRTGGNTSQRDAAFTGRAALTYVFDMGLAPYFSYSTAFLPNLGTFAPARGGGAFQPTTGEQFELGVKYQPPGRNSSLAATIYQLTQQNALSTDPVNAGSMIQTGEIRVRGLELEARARVLPEFDVIAAWTAQDPEVTWDTAATVGYRPVAVPSHLGSLWGDYRYRVSEEVTLGFGAGVRYIGNTLANNVAGGVFHTPSYTLYDAMLRADWRQWRLTVTGSNLGDKSYFSACYTTSCSYGQGRAVYATLAYRW